MAFLFRQKVKSPAELVKFCNDQFLLLGDEDSRTQKAEEEISKSLGSMKSILFGDSEHEPNPEMIQDLVSAIFSTEFLSLLVKHLPALRFESRKDAAHIFKSLMQQQRGQQKPGVDYVLNHPDLLPMLVKGYESLEIALMTGSMLRECLKHESLTKSLLYSNDFNLFFVYVELPTFDVASDAFASFREMLTKHKTICAEFLNSQYDSVFESYTKLLNSYNYATRRQSLKLLGELLLDRKNFAVMTKYIASTDNLKLIMNMLRDESKAIQFEAFHVFKVFVANPKKPDQIKHILAKNQQKLVDYLSSFHNDKDDDQFKEEKAFLIKEISNLQSPSSS